MPWLLGGAACGFCQPCSGVAGGVGACESTGAGGGADGGPTGWVQVSALHLTQGSLVELEQHEELMASAAAEEMAEQEEQEEVDDEQEEQEEEEAQDLMGADGTQPLQHRSR